MLRDVNAKRMNSITLTTDLGVKDHYVAAIKGSILSQLPEAVIIDITHHVRPFNIAQASFFLKNVIADFPPNTIHIIAVDAEPYIDFRNPENNALPTIMKFKGQYFIGTDNGIFSLLLEDEQPEELWELDDVMSRPEGMPFPTKRFFVPAACALASGKSPDEIASPKNGFVRKIVTRPIVTDYTLKGSVIHIDHYGNLITNIKKSDFERFGAGTPFVIYFRQREYYIDKISFGYNEVPAGEKLALFNDAGLLEIAINKGTPENGGGANSLFGMRNGDVIRIEFSPRGSAERLDSLF